MNKTAVDLPSPAREPLEENPWTTEDTAEPYHLRSWGDGYFTTDDQGEVVIRPTRSDDETISIYEVARDLKDRQVPFPVLIRFQDVLQGRVRQLHNAFSDAIQELGYQNRYNAVYPIKVNQLHEVVEEVLEAGRPYGMGLECGSKAELVAAMAHLENDDTLLICNGYKDDVMLQQILTGQQLGKSVLPVLEKYNEFERLLAQSAARKLRPRFGVRVRLTSSGAGRWSDSGGDLSKFGISIPELLTLVQTLEAQDLTDAFALLHFHLGSQISNIQTLKKAVKEITQIYVQLKRKGVPIQYLDVGGGLGVNYEADFLENNEGINYTLQEYANAVIHSIMEVCDAEQVDHPVLVSESGRAVTAHHSVLIVETLGAYQKDQINPDFRPADSDHVLVHELFATWEWMKDPAPLRLSELLEAYHDAVEKRQQADSLFSFGYLPMEQKALAERLYWSVCYAINARIQKADVDWLPPELLSLDEHLIDQYLCDFSVFQSILDHWAIGQRFPIMPIHRLDEPPRRRAVLVDLTCDSDGKVSRYVSSNRDKRFLNVHDLLPDEPYFLGFFLMGAYQDIMGDTHNLFGRVTEVHIYADREEPNGYYIEKMIPGTTVEQMLALVQYFPNDLERRMQAMIRAKIDAGLIRPKMGVRLLEQYTRTFTDTTYYTPSATS